MFRTRTERGEGFTLLEVIVATSVLAIALVGLISGLTSSMRLRQMNQDKALARNEAERVLSAIRGMPSIVEAYQRFGGAGSENTFDVYGLPQPAPNQPVGTVIVWRRKDGNPPDPAAATPLTAQDRLEAMARFGAPFPLNMTGEEGPFGNDFLDTNLDGVVDGADTPTLMPVTVRIRWRSRNGIVTQYFSTIVGRR